MSSSYTQHPDITIIFTGTPPGPVMAFWWNAKGRDSWSHGSSQTRAIPITWSAIYMLSFLTACEAVGESWQRLEHSLCKGVVVCRGTDRITTSSIAHPDSGATTWLWGSTHPIVHAKAPPRGHSSQPIWPHCKFSLIPYDSPRWIKHTAQRQEHRSDNSNPVKWIKHEKINARVSTLLVLHILIHRNDWL